MKFKNLYFLLLLQPFIIHANLLHDAVKNSDIESTTKLLSTIDINTQDANGLTALHHAESPIIAQLLINAGADVNIQDEDGNTPLHHIIIYEFFYDDEIEEINEYKELITLLIQSQKDLNIRNNREETPLLTSLIEQSHIASKLLLTFSEGVDIDAQDDGFITALHIAALDNALEIAQLLIQAGANINNCSNPDNVTSLHIAIVQNSFEVAELLIESGADTSIKDAFGNTAYNYCTTTKMQSLFSK